MNNLSNHKFIQNIKLKKHVIIDLNKENPKFN
jgi:hypothetical protein